MRKTSFFLAAAWLAAAPLFSQNKGASPIPNSTNSTNSTTTRAVVIGISDYQDADIPDLRFADRDAEAFANFLRSPAGGGLDNDHLQVLTNEKATAGRVAEALDALVEQAKEGDQAIIYFSGHGDVERKTISQPGFLLCWDSPARVYMGGGTYSLAFLQEIVTTLSTQNRAKVLVVTDACHAGKLAGSQIGGAQATAANLAKQFANEVKILSCQPDEFSLEGEQWGGGRGVFSYHLVEGLAGLADRNGDGSVSVGEIDRYLEDHVTAEAAPQSQVPMLLGNKTERLAAVNAAVLATLQKSKAALGGMAVFASTEGRGFEEDVLAKADPGTRQLYFSFKKAVAEKRFFQKKDGQTGPAGEAAAADELFVHLVEKAALAPLRGMMRRNYAAALQDDAQQAMNIWLKADVQQLECIGKSLKLEPIPRQLARAAELLGESHYMYRSLQARQLLFEGIALHSHSNPDEKLGRQLLATFRRAAQLEPNSPLPWHQMCVAYASNLRNPDSALVCARQAHGLAPNWVLPFTDLAKHLNEQREGDPALRAIQEAEAIDPRHPYVLGSLASWYSKQPGAAEKEKAVALMGQYRDSGGVLYPCWHNDLANALQAMGKTAESEAEYKKGLALDSTRAAIWGNLGQLYNETGRFAQAEPALKKAVELDPADAFAWNNLGTAYLRARRLAEAEPALKKAIALDSTAVTAWTNLGTLLLLARRFAEAEPVLKKAIALDPAFAGGWSSLGAAYLNLSRYPEAEATLTKAIALDPAMPNPRRHLGMAQFKTGRPDEARRNFLKAIELNPNYAAAMLGMAYVLAAEGKAAEAIGYIEQAIGKRSTFEQLESDEDLAPLRALPEWQAMMKKHFPDKAKD